MHPDSFPHIISPMNSMREQSRKMALCGIMGALSAMIMTAGGLIPVATYLSPMVAGACLIPVLWEYGPKTVTVLYAAVAILAVLISPDKESSFIFVFLGWYPALIPALDKVRSKGLRFLIKIGIFLIAIVLAYYLMIGILGIGDMMTEFKSYSVIMLIAMVIMGGVTFLLTDHIYRRLLFHYGAKWRQKLWKDR